MKLLQTTLKTGVHRIALLALAVQGFSPMAEARAPIDIGNRLELFVDRYLIEGESNTRLKPGAPRREEQALAFDAPWEGRFAGASTVLKDGEIYRMYYRGSGYGPDKSEDRMAELTCYAESHDGIHWIKPKLGLHEFKGGKDNNIILPPGDKRRISHNFMAFVDARPGVPAAERYKGVGGTREYGLYRLV